MLPNIRWETPHYFLTYCTLYMAVLVDHIEPWLPFPWVNIPSTTVVSVNEKVMRSPHTTSICLDSFITYNKTTILSVYFYQVSS